MLGLRPRHHLRRRNAGALAASGIADPLLRQIQSSVDQRIACAVAQHAEHADLAVVHLAQPAAPLPRHTNRILPFLAKPDLSISRELSGSPPSSWSASSATCLSPPGDPTVNSSQNSAAADSPCPAPLQPSVPCLAAAPGRGGADIPRLGRERNVSSNENVVQTVIAPQRSDPRGIRTDQVNGRKRWMGGFCPRCKVIDTCQYPIS